MSDPRTALNGASDTKGIATVSELGPIGMIAMRADFTDKTTAKTIEAAGGVALPEQRKISIEGTQAIAWMSPDERLILCDYAQVHARLSDLQERLKGVHALAVNVSDARAMFRVSNGPVREVLAKLAPVDLQPGHFASGDFRRSRLAQVPAAFWMPDEESVQIICFRSVAQYVFDVLNVAAQDGSEIAIFSSAT